jgi:hypothetical protein
MSNPATISQMDGELKQKIVTHADKSYFAEHQKSLRETTETVRRAINSFAAKGKVLSGEMVQEIARIESDHIKTLILAKANALLEGYELYGCAIDNFIQVQANELRWDLIRAISRDPHLLPPGVPASGMFEQLLVQNTSGILETIECEIERRKVIPKLSKSQPGVQNIYHLHGNNSRVNINSTDQSVNVVNITSQELFVHLRQLLLDNVNGETQTRILERLDALEKAQNTPTFGQRYAEFIAAAANYTTLLSPFMPALAEMVKKALAG